MHCIVFAFIVLLSFSAIFRLSVCLSVCLPVPAVFNFFNVQYLCRCVNLCVGVYVCVRGVCV